MNILGISCFFHDAAAALVQDGIVTAAAEEERFSRVKHDAGFPLRAIEFCLRTGKVRAEDLDWVVFYEKPFLKLDRLLMSTLQTFPRSFRLFRESMVRWLGEKLWVKGLIARRTGIPAEKILFSSHHMSHAASAFYPSPYRDAAILTVDGVGEWATATFGVGRDKSIEFLGEIRFPHSLGLLYSVFTAFLGFEVNEGEYKVMGMAPYGTPKYVDDVRKLVRLHDDGGFALDMEYFSFHRSPDTAFNAKFERLFGPPRAPGSHFFTEASGYPSYFGDKPANYDDLCRQNQHYADIAASIQVVTEETLLAMARVVDALQAGKVIGWSQGRFEGGPRALGNRSILADPRRADMKDIVNTKIKFREPYRPFAPSVLVERAHEFYDLKDAERHYPARFMLLVVDVDDAKLDVVPAPTHVDLTAL